MPHPLEVLYAVVAAHIPPDVMGAPHHDFGNGGCPASAANDGYVTATIHRASPPTPLQRARGVITTVRQILFYSHYDFFNIVVYLFILKP